jgi:hypothetical protein
MAPDEPADGTERLAREAREEAARLASHPVEEIKRLEGIVATGDSPATPFLATLGVWAFVAVVFVIVLVIVFAAYYIAK